MPNHVYNRVTVEGDSETIKEMIDFAGEVHDGEIDLISAWKILPIPASIKTSKPDVLSDEEYNWRLDHWGTKWGNYEYIEKEWTNNEVNFLTAWSPSLLITSALSKKFPTLVFKHCYADIMNGFAGEAYFAKGCQTKYTEYEEGCSEYQYMLDMLGICYVAGNEGDRDE